MSPWERRIAESGIYDRMDELRGELTADEWQDEDVQATVTRSLRVLAHVKARIEAADAELVGLHVVNQIREHLNNAMAQIRAYRNAPDVSYFNNVDAQLDGVLALAAQIEAHRDAARDASHAEIESYRDFVVSAEGRIRTTVDELQRYVVDVRASAENAVEEVQGRVDSLEAQVRAVSDQGASALERHRAEHQDAITKFVTESTEAMTAAENDAQNVMVALSELKERAQDIVGVIARTGMTGGYQEYEKEERASADRWRKYAVWFGLGAVVVLVAGLVLSFVRDADEIGHNIASAALTATLLGLATYAARQSARHRHHATGARNTALELASLGPYLETLDAERRQEVIEAFAFVFFGQRPLVEDESDAVAPAHVQAAFDLLKRRRSDTS